MKKTNINNVNRDNGNLGDLNKSNINLEDINIDDISVSSKLDDIIKNAVNEGYEEVDNKNYKSERYRNMMNSNNRKFKKGIVAAAIAVAVGVTAFGVAFGDEALATVKMAMFDIGKYLGINKNLEDYKTVVNSAVSKNGITVQLNEVILNKDEVILSTTVKSDKELGENGNISLFGSVYVNGKKASSSASGTSKVIDEYTQEEVMSYNLDKELLQGDLYVEVKYDEAYVYINGEKDEVKGPWKFEFESNGDALMINTNTIELNNSFELENGQKITLNEYVSNDMGQKIYYSVENKDKNNVYDVVLRGYDDLGNEVEFYSSYEELTNGLMKNQTEILEEATTLILTPYAVAYPKESGKMSNDYKQVGQEFTIRIK